MIRRPQHPPHQASRQPPTAFTLAEVVITLGIVGSVLLTLLGLLVMAVDLSADASRNTVLGIIVEDLHESIRGEPLVAGTLAEPRFYDQRGARVRGQPGAWEFSSPLATAPMFRAEVRLEPIHPSQAPANADGLLALRHVIHARIHPDTGEPLQPEHPEWELVSLVGTATAPMWRQIDPSYQPKISF